ncbi:Multi antimicrobial extrusion protein - like 10 [Theobroma cacao]|nr:Multi antimicrobial extrusion protein - like 10 [Theobroma cacao]
MNRVSDELPKKEKNIEMPSSNTSLDTSALLSEANKHDQGRWWKKALDLQEAKNQVIFSLPMILTSVFYFSITMVSVMFAGHLGELELASATLANSWATVTGFAFMTGLSGALETLCGQRFECWEFISKRPASFLSFSLFSYQSYGSTPSRYLSCSDKMLKFQKLQPCTLGLFAYGFVQNILRFLQTQSVVMPLVWFSVLPLGIHFGIVYSLVNWTDLGFKGAPLAASVSLWISLLFLAVYVFSAKKFEQTWQGMSFESFHPPFCSNGVARGSVWANLGTFYFIGMPIAGLLGFKFKLYAMGLWIGLICGLACQAGALLLITLYRKWSKVEL